MISSRSHQAARGQAILRFSFYILPKAHGFFYDLSKRHVPIVGFSVLLGTFLIADRILNDVEIAQYGSDEFPVVDAWPDFKHQNRPSPLLLCFLTFSLSTNENGKRNEWNTRDESDYPINR